MAELLAQRCRVVLIDLPGFGKSGLPLTATNEGGGWDTLQYAARVKEVLESLSISRCFLVGHSLGGRISVRLAALAPDLVQAAVLIGAPGVPFKRTVQQQVYSTVVRTLVKLAKRVDSLVGTRFFAHYLAPRFGSQDYQAAGNLRKTLVKVVNEDLTAEARSIKAPTLLIWGEKDPQAPLAIGQRYNELLAHSELLVLPHRGHEPFADVGAHLIAAYIERFISQRGGCGAD
jgi:pimeloyl-ACP methyl ester carboxylesterase